MINWRTRAHQRHTETINGTDCIVEPSSFSRESGWSGRHACGLLMAGGDRIRGAKRPRSGARVGPAAARSHGLRSPCPWRLSGAHGAGDLRRDLRAWVAARRRTRPAERCAARTEFPRDRPLPGGNFLCGYHWLDGVGPHAQRPRRRELAWQSVETNQHGTNSSWTSARRSTPPRCWAVNMGTGTFRPRPTWWSTAMRLGTQWVDLRATHGYRRHTRCTTGVSATRWTVPGRSATWTAEGSTGARRAEAARCKCEWWIESHVAVSWRAGRAARACPRPTCLEWDREVLEEAPPGRSTASFAPRGTMATTPADDRQRHGTKYPGDESRAWNRQIRETCPRSATTCEGGRRSQQAASWLSFDEWNVWYRGAQRRRGERAAAVRAASAGGGLQSRGRACSAAAS